MITNLLKFLEHYGISKSIHPIQLEVIRRVMAGERFTLAYRKPRGIGKAKEQGQ